MPMGDKIIYKELSYKIIGIAMDVHRELGPGFLEKVYENAMMVLFSEQGIASLQQAPVEVTFHDKIIGDYYADILVEGKIILELKAVSQIAETHKAQIINYLKATRIRLGMLINFGNEKLEYQRFVL
jgi:GxxExxY protein